MLPPSQSIYHKWNKFTPCLWGGRLCLFWHECLSASLSTQWWSYFIVQSMFELLSHNQCYPTNICCQLFSLLESVQVWIWSKTQNLVMSFPNCLAQNNDWNLSGWCCPVWTPTVMKRPMALLLRGPSQRLPLLVVDEPSECQPEDVIWSCQCRNNMKHQRTRGIWQIWSVANVVANVAVSLHSKPTKLI